MKPYKTLLNLALTGLMMISLTSCFEDVDPGPFQEQEEDFSIMDFDRLEIGDALNVTVEQGSMYTIHVKGDRRNIDDLEVRKIGNTLQMRYENEHRSTNRQYTTYVTITTPTLEGASFSGAVTAKIDGFSTEGDFDMNLSGASNAQLAIEAASLKFHLSGASELNVSGATTNLDATVSGASILHGYDLETENATLDASGASRINVLVTKELDAKASGASDIRYRGTPVVSTKTSGASRIEAD